MLACEISLIALKSLVSPIAGPRANPLFVSMGEGNFDILEKYIAATMKFYVSVTYKVYDKNKFHFFFCIKCKFEGERN